jgi:hypothetical protein
MNLRARQHPTEQAAHGVAEERRVSGSSAGIQGFIVPSVMRCGMLSVSQLLEVHMQTSRFQLGLIATLAVGLGFSLASSDAVGYPAGAAVSMGENPLWTVGGNTDSTTVISAPEDQDMVITDLILSIGYNTQGRAILTASSGPVLGEFYLESYNSIERHVRHAFASGIRIPRGESVTLTGDTRTYYSISGYYAQP